MSLIHRQLLVFLSCLLMVAGKAQNDTAIINELTTINKTVTNKQCGNGYDMVISNRAMNVFLADKTSYLSENGDLSYYTNYVTLNTSAGILTINHNLQKAKGIDEPIKKLFSFGIKANIADGFNTTFLDKQFKNQLSITVNQTWLGKVRTRISGCVPGDKWPNQKHAMNALRAGILHSLSIEIKNTTTDFETALDKIDSTELPRQNRSDAIFIARQNFYEDLKEKYQEKFARLQAEALTKTSNFKLITTHWTSLIGYVPLLSPKYNVAPSLTSPFDKKNPYPFEFTLSHTRLWESSKAGRFFITASGRIIGNNSANSFALIKTNFTEYKNLGGTDTMRFASLKTDELYIGDYKTFVTPSLRIRTIYFPSNFHFGVSVLLEKSFGSYNLTNVRVGVPVILINSKKLPAVNIEFQVSFFDLTHEITTERKFGNKTALSVGVGIPFSRLMY